MTTVTLTLDKGVNKDLLASELPPGYVSDCLNFRFRNGFAEKTKGTVSVNMTTASGTALRILNNTGWIFPIQAAGNPYAVVGDGTYAWAVTGSTYGNSSSYEITRYAKPQTISSLTRIGANTAQVTTTSSHGLSTSDKITLWGATEAGYNVTQATITKISATVFQYTTVTAIAADATVVGQYVVFTSSATSNFSGDGYTVTGGPLNGVLMMYMPSDGLHYWDATSTSTHIRQVPFTVPSGVTAMRPYKNYMVALAGKLVYWSDSADPGNIPTTFTAATGNDAGAVTLAETNGMCIDCRPLGDTNIIYKEDAMYEMQYIGGNQVFNFTRIPTNDGIVGKNCVVDTPVGHVFLTQNLDIKVYDGTSVRSIGEGRVRKWLASYFSPFLSNVLPNCLALLVNPEKNEVWVCFSTVGPSAVVPNRALVWNWDADTWGIIDIGTLGVIAGRSGIWPNSISAQQRLVLIGAAGGSSGLGIVDSAAAISVTGTLERTGIDFGDRDALKYIDRSRWNVDVSGTPTISVYHGASGTADGVVSYPASPGTWNGVAPPDYVPSRGVQNRFVALKAVTSSGSEDVLIRTIDLDIKSGGKR